MNSLPLQSTALILDIYNYAIIYVICVLFLFFSYSNLCFHLSPVLTYNFVYETVNSSHFSFKITFFMAFLLYQNIYCGKMSDLNVFSVSY